MLAAALGPDVEEDHEGGVLGGMVWESLARVVDTTPFLRVVRPLDLTRADTPSLTVDETGTTVVFVGRGKAVGGSTLLFSPLRGGAARGVHAARLAQAVARLLKAKRGALLAVAPPKPPKEAIIVCLDISKSMDSLSGFADGGDAGGDSSDGGDDDETEADSEADDFDEELWDAIESDDEDAGGGGAAAAEEEDESSGFAKGFLSPKKKKKGKKGKKKKKKKKKKAKSKAEKKEEMRYQHRLAAAVEILRTHPCRRELAAVHARARRLDGGGWAHEVQVEEMLPDVLANHPDPPRTLSKKLLKEVCEQGKIKIREVLREEHASVDEDDEDGGGGGGGDDEDEMSQFGPSGEHAPDALLCPISKRLMADPVLAEDGHTYDRGSISKWFSQPRNAGSVCRSPMTNALIGKDLKSNFHARSMVKEWLQEHPDGVGSEPEDSSEEESDDDTDEEEDGAARGEPNAHITCWVVNEGDDAALVSISIDLHVDPATFSIGYVKRMLRKEHGIGAKRGQRLKIKETSGSVELDDGAATLASLDIGDGGSLTVEVTEEKKKPKKDQKPPVPAWRRFQRPEWIVLHFKDDRGHGDAKRFSLIVKQSATVMQVQLRLLLVCEPRRFGRYLPKRHSLWAGLEDKGDGQQVGWRISDPDNANNSISHWSRHLQSGGDSDGDKGVLDVTRHYRVKTRREQRREEQRKERIMTRMACTKQCFAAFINRSEAYDLGTHLGLHLFGSEVKEELALTPLLENFVEALNGVEPEGDTSLYDAIDRGVSTLVEYKPPGGSDDTQQQGSGGSARAPSSICARTAA